MNLHGRMMNIPQDGPKSFTCDAASAYGIGHRDARHAAAEIAIEADRDIEMLLIRVGRLEAGNATLQTEKDEALTMLHAVADDRDEMAVKLISKAYEVVDGHEMGQC